MSEHERLTDDELAARWHELQALRAALDELRTLADTIVDREIKIQRMKAMKGEDVSELERLQRKDEWYLVQLAHTSGEVV